MENKNDAAANVQIPDAASIQMPSVDSIGEMPKVDLPSTEAVGTAPNATVPTIAQAIGLDASAAQPAQPVPAAPAQPVSAAPVQSVPPVSQPVQAASYAPPAYHSYAPTTYAPQAPAANPYAATAYAAAAKSGKRTGGQIAALIIGILLTVVGGFFTAVMILADLITYSEQGYVDVDGVVYGVFLVPLIVGIVLIVIGAKKKKTALPTVNTGYASYAPAAVPGAQGYAAPVQNYGTAQPAATVPTAMPVNTAAPVNATAAPVTAPTAVPVNTAAPVNPGDAAVSAAAPVNPSDTAADTSATTPAGANPMTYQYTSTGMIGEDAEKMTRKSARNSGLLAIGCIIIMWVLVFALDILSWYLLIIPFILSFRALKTNVKSPAGWFGMILSVLSVVLLVLLLIASSTLS